MAFMFCSGHCLTCGGLFSFNPDLVPSVRVNAQGQPDPNGTREPICQNCMRLANEQREQRGLPPFPVLPGAYEPQEVA